MNVLINTLVACSRFGNPNLNAVRSIAYRSAISLETLYPNSTLKISTPTKPATSVHEKFSGYIPVEQLQITYSRSTGPGGQNVNKVNTKVDLRFHLESADWLDVEIRTKLAEILKLKLTKEGFLVFRSDLTRSQQLNLADCLEKLRSCIRDALYEAPQVSEDTLEKIRRKKEKAARERLAFKREKSQTKSDRQAPDVRELL